MSEFRATPSCPWPLLSKKDVEEASPSQKEGMAYQKEMSFMRSMCELMKRTGKPHSSRSPSVSALVNFYMMC